jgi:hypothetical protein
MKMNIPVEDIYATNKTDRYSGKMDRKAIGSIGRSPAKQRQKSKKFDFRRIDEDDDS